MYTTIKYEVNEGLAKVTINRPEALNALNTTVLDELSCVFDEIEKDEAVKAVIVTGEGRSFVAGADIAQMSKLTPEEAHAMMAKGHAVMNKIEALPKAVVAAVNGFALGGGCELAMACDIRVASEKALFGQPEVGLGIIPGFGGTIRLAKLVGKGMAKYLIMAAENIKAPEAYRIGLVEKIVAPEDLMAEAEKVARQIMAKAPIAVRQAKMAIDSEFDMDMRAASRLEVEAITTCFASQDQKEGMEAFLGKRAPEFQNK
ncbi:MAG: enoyl-CoA hydratase/isomerase family protein [Firmicutes bacterium]|nr:enoyl-CoA hydratase/isomerase family protein [Bacillota bacterium]